MGIQLPRKGDSATIFGSCLMSPISATVEHLFIYMCWLVKLHYRLSTTNGKKSSAVAEMDDRLATVDKGRKLTGVCRLSECLIYRPTTSLRK